MSELAVDCSGLVLPTFAGQTVDVLRTASVVTRAERAAAVLEEACQRAAPGERECLEVIRATLSRLSPTMRLRALRHPLASFDVQAELDAGEPVEDAREPVARALALARYLIGLDGLGRMTLVLPPRAFAAGPLLLPHLHVSLDGLGGPVAVMMEAGTTRLTWADGARVTLPPDGAHGWQLGKLPGLIPAVESQGIAVLNGSPEIARAFAAFGLADRDQSPMLLEGLVQGLVLMHAMWPAVADMAERFLAGVLLLQPREGIRSHTSARLQGVVLSSARDPVQMADVLCHELAHVRIALFLEHDPLLIDDGSARYPSPWRRDLRPLIGLLLGVHAFLNVCHFYRRLREGGVATDIAEPIYDRQRENVRTGFDLLRKEANSTSLGAALLSELEREVAAL